MPPSYHPYPNAAEEEALLSHLLLPLPLPLPLRAEGSHTLP